MSEHKHNTLFCAQRSEEEIHYGELFEQANDLIQSVDSEGRFLYVNKKWRETLGYSTDEARRMTFPQIIHPDHLSLCLSIFEKLKQGESVDAFETAFVSKSGMEIVVEGSISTQMKEGKLVATWGIFRDITLRRKVENKLAKERAELDRIAKRLVRRDFELMQTNEAMRLLDEEKAKHEALLLSIGDGVVATDTEEKIMFINTAAEEMIGWSAQDGFGKSWFSLVTVEDENGGVIKRAERPIARTLSSGRKTNNSSYQYVRKDGVCFPVSITVAPIILNGKTTGAVVVFRDITEEKAIDKAKSEFVSLASHQLKTPLSIIKWYTEMLLSVDAKRLSATQKKYIQKLYGANERMIKLVKALLNVSRIELGAFLIEPEPTNLQKIAESVLEELCPVTTAKKLNIITDYDSKLPTINADKKLIRIVFQNLISNAVKYTSRGGSISLSIKEQAEDMLITITDTGYGIPKKQQSKIFKKLFRADNAQAIDSDGTGLGLYIVKAVIEQSGGKIWFESPAPTETSTGSSFDKTIDKKENPGTTFYFTIPLAGMKKKKGTKGLVAST